MLSRLRPAARHLEDQMNQNWAHIPYRIIVSIRYMDHELLSRPFSLKEGGVPSNGSSHEWPGGCRGSPCLLEST